MKPFLLVLAGVSVLGIVTPERTSCLKRAAFSSINFENILTWETAADIPPGTVFDVQYKQYGQKSWLTKHECQSITQLFCNLSQETENFTEHFYGRVRARGCSSGWVRSDRFEPRKETIIGAPQVEHIPHVRSVKFLIRPPLTPLRGEDDQQLTVEDIYSTFGAVDYHLTIFNQRTQQQWTKNEHSKEFEVSNLEPDTEYNGTVYICLLQKKSKPQVFWVKTLADKTWILYCLVALAFCAGLVFAAIAYVIYKYIKQHSAQPRALDFRGIPPFQPLTLTVEHIIKPLSLSKPALSIPEVQLAQMSQHLDWALEPLCPYQQQADVPTLQLPPEPSQVPIPAATAYAPQAGEQSCPAATRLPLTYGLCVGGTEQPHPRLKEPPPDPSADGKLQTLQLGKSCGHWDYTEQPKVALWTSRDRLESVVTQGSPGQSQLLLQREELENPECVSRLSLALLEQGGCYTQQAALPLLLSAGKAAPDCVPEEELLAPLSAALLLSVRTGNHGEHWELPEALPETAGMEMFPAAKELSCTELSVFPARDTELSVSPARDTGLSVSPARDTELSVFPARDTGLSVFPARDTGLSVSPARDTELSVSPARDTELSVFPAGGTPLTMLFKDLDLKVQWDDEEDSTGVY